MKKVILAALLMLLGTTPMYSQFFHMDQPKVRFSIGAYGGYNFSGGQPQIGAFVRASGWNFMGEIDAGYTKADVNEEEKSFVYLNPSVGIYWGEKVRVYGLIGITNWAAHSYLKERIITDKICSKIKLGMDITLVKNLFITVNWSYVFTDDEDDYYDRYYTYSKDLRYFGHNALNVGLGLRF